MAPSQTQALAFKRLAVSPEGKEVIAYLEQRLQKELDELMAIEDPHQVRRAQGACRVLKSIVMLTAVK